MEDTGDAIRVQGECIPLCLPGGLEVSGKGGSSSAGPLQSQDKFMLLQGQDILMLYQQINEGTAEFISLLCRKRNSSTVKPYFKELKKNIEN